MKLPLSPIIRRSVADEVSLQLTSWIESGKLKIGDLLPAERQLAADLGVSRVVIRDATKKLAQQGLVNIRQGVGVRVVNNPSFSVTQTLNLLVPQEKKRLLQCAQARALIEPELAGLAALHAKPENLRKLFETNEALLQEKDVPKAALLDIEFHEQIAEMTGNRVLGLMLTSIAELGRMSRETTIRRVGVRRAYDGHAKILSAISAGNALAAKQAMTEHLGATVADLS